MRFFLKLACVALLGVVLQVGIEIYSINQCDVRIGTADSFVVDNEATELRVKVRLQHCTCITRVIFRWYNAELV